jgi:hypothetical protein
MLIGCGVAVGVGVTVGVEVGVAVYFTVADAVGLGVLLGLVSELTSAAWLSPGCWTFSSLGEHAHVKTARTSRAYQYFWCMVFSNKKLPVIARFEI